MRKLIYISLLLCSLFTAPAWAAGTQTGQVTMVMVRASDGLVWFNMNGKATGHPSCAFYNYWMIKNENSNAGKQQLTQLLTARASGQAITVTGSGTCTRWPDGEDVGEIDY